MLTGLGAGFFALRQRPAAGVAPPATRDDPISGSAMSFGLVASAPKPTPASAPEADVEEARHLDAFLAALIAAHPFGRERQAVLREILEQAPPSAVEALLRVTFGDEGLNDITHVLIERLAAVAPEAALVFAGEKRFGIEPPWWHSVIGGLADPRLASDGVLALPPSETRTNLIGHIALRIGDADTEAAVGYALREVPAGERAVAFANAVIGVARRDPAAALALASAHGEDVGLVRSLAVDWAMDDPIAARSHILALPAGAVRQAALEGLGAAVAGRGAAEADK